MSSNTTIDFNLLIPNFSELFTNGWTTTDGFSALIVAITLGVMLFFGLCVIRKSCSILGKIRFYKKRIDEISQANINEKANKVREITREIESNKKWQKYLYLWREYDNSLIKTESGNIYSSLDASHFFNSHTLAQGLIESRLFAAVPGMLTAIGVLGTFSGLQIGLAGIELSDADKIQQGIATVINGATVAFMTSVWGVATSFIFNLFEKVCEKVIRKEITKLQNKASALFRNKMAEESLLNLELETKASKDILAGLSEKIGNEMQKVMDTASQTISESIVSSLHTTLDKIANNASQGSQEALSTLIENFLDKFGSAGETQKEAINQASSTLAKSSEMMMEHLSNFAQDLKGQFSEITSQNSHMVEQMQLSLGKHIEQQSQSSSTSLSEITQTIEKFTTNLQMMLDNFNQQNANMTEMLSQNLREQLTQQQSSTAKHQEQLTQSNEAFSNKLVSLLENLNTQQGEMLKSVETALTASIESQQHKNEQRQRQLTELVSQSQQSQSSLLKDVNVLLQIQDQQNQQLSMSLTQLTESFAGLVESNGKMLVEFKTLSENIHSSSGEFSSLSRYLTSSIQQFGQELSQIFAMVSQVTQQNHQTSTTFNQVIDKLSITNTEMENSVEKIKQAAENSKEGFNLVSQHFSRLPIELKQHLAELNDQISDLLTKYSHQVETQINDRLNQWNSQTNEYTSTMTTAVQTLSAVVDEIDTKNRMKK